MGSDAEWMTSDGEWVRTVCGVGGGVLGSGWRVHGASVSDNIGKQHEEQMVLFISIFRQLILIPIKTYSIKHATIDKMTIERSSSSPGSLRGMH